MRAFVSSPDWLTQRFAAVASCAERLPLLINSSSWPRSSAVNRTTYFLTAISFPATNHLPRWLAATEIQKLPSFSMTGATSSGWVPIPFFIVLVGAEPIRGDG
jgi:hypothetical protein